MKEHECDCGCVPGHSTPEECSRNRAATVTMMNQQTQASLNSSIARGDMLAAQHDGHLTPQYGCPKCPIGSNWKRETATSEWVVVE